jgi:hypothetical protein
MARMNRLQAMLRSQVVAALLLAVFPAQAMTIQQYDKMADKDQARYVQLLVEGAQQVLIDQGQRDLAAKVYQLFRVRPGDDISLGIWEFNQNLDLARLADANRLARDPNALAIHVEAAMMVTLKKNGIELPKSYFDVGKDFKPNYPAGERLPPSGRD